MSIWCLDHGSSIRVGDTVLQCGRIAIMNKCSISCIVLDVVRDSFLGLCCATNAPRTTLVYFEEVPLPETMITIEAL